MKCTISYPSFCERGRCVFSCCCVMAYGLAWLYSCCMFSWTSRSLSMISSHYASAILTTSSPLSWNLSMTSSASSSIRVMYGSSVSIFLLLCASFFCVGFLTIFEGYTPLVVPWVLSSLACEVSFFPFYGWLHVLVVVGVLLGCFGIVFFLVG
jgi:hypothetical protein